MSGPASLRERGFEVTNESPAPGISMAERVRLVDAAPIKPVPLNKLIATQATVRPDEVTLLRKTSAQVEPGRRSAKGLLVDHPIVVKRDGSLFVLDGHHRAAAAKERGETTIAARVVDLTNSGGLSTWAKRQT